MTTVFLVSSGRYSDYSVCAIFTKRDAAQSFIDRFQRCDYWNEFNDIEERELDPEMPSPIPEGMKRFRACVNSGVVTHAFENEESVENYGEFVTDNEVYVYARDEDHAKKIAVERIQAEKRRKAFEAAITTDTPLTPPDLPHEIGKS